METDYSDWGPCEMAQEEEECTVARVLIIGVTHSLCVFMCLLVIAVHVCVRISGSQSVSEQLQTTARQQLSPSTIRNSGLVHNA